MNNQEEDWDEFFQGVDAALRRAAQTAKKLAEQNGTPYVVVEAKNNRELQQVKNETKR